jgi:hypothetical protein
MSFFVRAMRVGPCWWRWKGGGGPGILIASIPFDVKFLVLLDNLPRKGLASVDGQPRKHQYQLVRLGQTESDRARHLAEPHPPKNSQTQKEL